MMNMFFLYDEFTDAESKEGVANVATISMDAVRNPTIPRPAGENPVGEIVRQYVVLAGSIHKHHFSIVETQVMGKVDTHGTISGP